MPRPPGFCPKMAKERNNELRNNPIFDIKRDLRREKYVAKISFFQR
jgi:hypothetical protein